MVETFTEVTRIHTLMRTRFLLLWLSLLFAAVIFVLVATPVAWRLAGSPSESYPELFFLAFGAPPAIILNASSMFIAFYRRRDRGWGERSAFLPLHACMAATVATFAVLMLILFLGTAFPKGALQSIMDCIFYIGWPVLVAWMVAAAVWAVMARSRARKGAEQGEFADRGERDPGHSQ